MMDCDTTGVEPDFSLVKSKRLVGGGEITIVNKTVPMALAKLGYAPTEADEVVAFIDERNTIVGAPYVKTEHYPVFDCAIGDRAIHYMGHVKMMGAVQPFISGAISKTVNLPEEITVDEVSQLFVESWQLGVKAIAIYRDNCKVAQPLSGKANAGATTLAPVSGAVGALPQRRRLPDDRIEVGRKFKVGEYEGYIHVGLFDDGTPGDIFVDIAKEGTTLAGLMNSFMISVSLGLQYGVPLEVYVSKFSHMRFEPSGMTNDADIRIAKSIVDYIFRWMGKKFLSTDQQEEAGILTAEVKARLAAAYTDAGDGRRCRGCSARPGAGRPDGALQPVGGRAGVRPLRRPHGADGQLLHVPRLRHQHRLLIGAPVLAPHAPAWGAVRPHALLASTLDAPRSPQSREPAPVLGTVLEVQTLCRVEGLVGLPPRVPTERAAHDPAPRKAREREAAVRDVRRAAWLEIELEGQLLQERRVRRPRRSPPRSGETAAPRAPGAPGRPSGR